MTIQSLATSWKTTSAGLIMIGYSLVDFGFAWYNKTLDAHIMKSTVVAIVGGVGLMLAGDASTSVTKTEADTTFLRKPDAAPLTSEPPKTP